MHLHMYMCRELTYIFTGGSYLGVRIWKPKIMYYLHTSILVSPMSSRGNPFWYPCPCRLWMLPLILSFRISDLFHMGLPSGSLLLPLLIMVFKFNVFFLNIGKVGLWLQYFDEWKAIIVTLPLVFCLRLSHRKTSVIIKVCEFVICMHLVYSTLHDFKELSFSDSYLESCDP